MLPAKLGDLMSSMARVLEIHTKALDLADDDSRREHDVYLKLAAEQRDVAMRLGTIGEEMAGQRDLPMGRHDPRAMSSPEAAEAFRAFVTAEEELLIMLKGRVPQDRAMLEDMSRAGG